MSEYTAQRLTSAKVKAEQLRETGAAVVVTSCHNCVDGLTDLIRHYKLDMKVTQLVNLVAEALVIEERIPAVPAVEVAEVAVLTGRKIVVADDEPDQVIYLKSVLEDHGAEVHTAEDGDAALELSKRLKPDLLTLDLAMPGREVTEIFDILRGQSDLADLKICIITGRPEMRKLIYERMDAPPDGYLDKPVEEEELILAVRKILEIKVH